MAKAKRKRTKKEIKTEWDPWYCKMLDAVSEYIGNMEDGDGVSERDQRIIRALVEFYGFNFEDIGQIMDDMSQRVAQLESQNSRPN